MTIRQAEHDILQDLLLLENSRIDQGQQHVIERLRRHVRALWHRVQRIESILSRTKNELTLQIGDASLIMNQNGTIVIKGNNIVIKASGQAEINGNRINIKASSVLTLKGQRIEEN